MPEDAGHDRGLFDEGDEAQPPAAPRARQDIEPERPLHERGPLLPSGSLSSGAAGGGWVGGTLVLVQHLAPEIAGA